MIQTCRTRGLRVLPFYTTPGADGYFATPDDGRSFHAEFGLKAVAVYRDGCKRVQPLSTQGFAPAGGS